MMPPVPHWGLWEWFGWSCDMLSLLALRLIKRDG